jgi:hypothetical protein
VIDIGFLLSVEVTAQAGMSSSRALGRHSLGGCVPLGEMRGKGKRLYMRRARTAENVTSLAIFLAILPILPGSLQALP